MGLKLALQDEIKAVRSGGGQKTYLSDGRYLGQRDGQFLYSFSASSELRFPDDTRIDLEYNREKYGGLILTKEGFDVIISLIDYIGSNIPTAILYTAPGSCSKS